jgi:hypothetical protein
MAQYAHDIEDREALVATLSAALSAAARNDVSIEGAFDVTTDDGNRYEAHVTRVESE